MFGRKVYYLIVIFIISIFITFGASFETFTDKINTNNNVKNKVRSLAHYKRLTAKFCDGFNDLNGSEAQNGTPFYTVRNFRKTKFNRNYQKNSSCYKERYLRKNPGNSNIILQDYFKDYESVFYTYYIDFFISLTSCDVQDFHRSCGTISKPKPPKDFILTCNERFYLEFLHDCGKNEEHDSIAKFSDEIVLSYFKAISTVSTEKFAMNYSSFDKKIQCALLYDNDKFFDFVLKSRYIKNQITKKNYLEFFFSPNITMQYKNLERNNTIRQKVLKNKN